MIPTMHLETVHPTHDVVEQAFWYNELEEVNENIDTSSYTVMLITSPKKSHFEADTDEEDLNLS